MPQDIQQNIKIEVTSSGIDSAISSLERLERTIKNCTAEATKIKTALSSLSSTKVSTNFAKDIQSQMKKATASVSNFNSASSLSSVASNAKKSTTSVTTLNKSMNDLGKTTKKVAENAEDATWNFFRFRAIAAAALAGVGMLGAGILQWYKLSSDYAEANHLLYATLAGSMEKVADAEKTAGLTALDMYGNVIKMDDGVTDATIQTTQAVADAVTQIREMGSSLGLFSTDLNRTFATFYEMGNSAGMLSEDLAKVSVGLTQLTYDLSSLWDMPFAETAGRLQSALAGNTTAVKSLGIDISRTAADAWLLNNGIDATYNSLDRASKMIVIYNMLMEKTATAHGDLAASAMQPANMLRILGEQAKDAASKLGGALFPLLTQLIPIAVAIANAIGQAATALSAFLGIKLGATYTDSFNQWNDFMGSLGGSSSSAGASLLSVSDSVSSVGAAADSSAVSLLSLSDDASMVDSSFSNLGSEASSAISLLDQFGSSVEDTGDSISMLSADDSLNSLTDLSNTVQDINASPLSIDETHAVQPLDVVNDTAQDTLDTLNEIKNFQLGFDELHVMPETTETGGSGGGGGGSGSGTGGGGSGIVAIDPYEMDDTVLEQILKRAQEQLEALAAWIDKVFGEGTWEQIQATVSQVIDSIVANFNKLIESVGILVGSFIGLFDWPELIRGFGDGFDTVLTVITEVITAVMDLVSWFFNLAPVKDIFHDISYAIGFTLGGITALATATLGAKVAFKLLHIAASPLIGVFKLAGDGIKTFSTKIGSLVGFIKTVGMDILTTPGGIVEWYNNAIGSAVTFIDNFILKLTGVPGVLTGILTPIGGLFQKAFGSIGTILFDAGGMIDNFAGKLGPLKVVAEPLAGVFEKVGLKLVGLTNPVTIAVNVLMFLVDAFTLVYSESETFRETVSNAIKGVEDAFNHVKEWLQPFVDTFFNALEDLNEKLTGTRTEIDGFGAAWETIKNVLVTVLEPILTPLVNVLGNLAQIVIQVAGVVGSLLLAAFTMIVDVISAVATAVDGLGSIFQGFGDLVNGILSGNFDLIGQGLWGIASGFGNLVKGLVEGVTSLIDGPLGWLGDVLGIEMPDLSEMATGALDSLGGFLTDTFAPDVAYAAESAEGSFQEIEDSAATHSENAETSVSDSWSTINEDITGNAADAASSASDSWSTLSSDTSGFMFDIGTNIGETWNGIQTDVSTAASQAQTAAIEQWNLIASNTNTLMAQAQNTVSSIWEQIKTTVYTLANEASNTVMDAWNNIVSMTNSILVSASEAVTTIFNGIKDSINSVMNSIVETVSGAWNAISGIFSSIGEGVSGALSSVGGLFSSFSTMAATPYTVSYSAAPMSAAPNVGWYATGGIFTKPSIIGLAEAGNEAVVPLSGARMRPFAQAVAMELKTNNKQSSVNTRNDAAFISAVSTAVYNAMINGFPEEIKGDVYLDSEKVGDSLRKKDRQRGIGTSLVRSM